MTPNTSDREIPSVADIRELLGQNDAVDTDAHMASLMKGMNNFPTGAELDDHARLHAKVLATLGSLEDGEEQGPSMPVQGDDAIQNVG